MKYICIWNICIYVIYIKFIHINPHLYEILYIIWNVYMKYICIKIYVFMKFIYIYISYMKFIYLCIFHTHMYMHTYISHIYIFDIHMCVCVYVCEYNFQVSLLWHSPTSFDSFTKRFVYDFSLIFCLLELT